ncbi:penicillin-binding transpeptidase domain-containing protein, partial [Acinetobacter pittii]|uniref:penicillin-binding transpeptidase domain-containing protein n=1 Tax=Acinetobacter pittii TaxID=48296 RepID=UPI003AF827ED
LGWHTIRDTHHYAALTVSGVIIKSSNVGSAKIALSLPTETLPSFFNRAGFGKRSAVKFTVESSGLVLPVSKLNSSQIGTMAYG